MGVRRHERPRVAAAKTLVASHPLRTLDAIHVASAQIFANRLVGSDLVFVSADARQNDVAAAIGLTVRSIMAPPTV